MRKSSALWKARLRGFIEDLIQSENGPSEDDLAYIEAERKYIASLKAI